MDLGKSHAEVMADADVYWRKYRGIQIKLDKGAILPTKTFPSDAGIDLYTFEDVTLEPKSFTDIRTGAQAKFPNGFFGRITGRSSTWRVWKLNVIEGICDEGYTGELIIGVMNLNFYPVEVPKYTRLAQLVLQATVDVPIVQVDELPPTQRGNRGFGSSGK